MGFSQPESSPSCTGSGVFTDESRRSRDEIHCKVQSALLDVAEGLHPPKSPAGQAIIVPILEVRRENVRAGSEVTGLEVGSVCLIPKHNIWF